MMLVDLEELPTLFSRYSWWSIDRSNLASFFRTDHFGDASESLDSCVRKLVFEKTGATHSGPIRLLTHFRYFGYVINPISLFYCLSGEDVDFVVAEVTNTPWKERICYVLDVRNQDGQFKRASVKKQLHVSPFLQMDYRYEFGLSIPAETLSVHIENRRSLDSDERHAEQTGPTPRQRSRKPRDVQTHFDATLKLRRREINSRNLAKVIADYPLMTFKVFAAIHWQALRLWWRGAGFVPHPAKL